MKEIDNLSASQTQKAIFGNTVKPEGIARRIELTRKGLLPYGITLEEADKTLGSFQEVFGEFTPSILILSNPANPNSLIPEQLAVAGGWCALRTRDVATLSDSAAIVNPKTRNIESVRSVEQVVRWIQQSVAFDQIKEGVGAVVASEYVVISEQKLWSLRIIGKLENIFSKKLSQKEKEQVEQAVENAETIRSLMTRRYITYVTGQNNIIFSPVVDEDIWEELKRARDEMFAKAGLSMQQLRNWYPREKITIPYSSIVWAMYNEPYFDMLRQEGYISKKRVFVVEPSLHATCETEAETEMAIEVYRKKGPYQDPKGFNANTGFIAYLECVTGNGKNARKELSVGDVPNIMNWQDLFSQGDLLDPDQNLTLSVNENQLFIWAANLVPLGRVKQALLALVALQDLYREERIKLNGRDNNGDNDSRTLVQQKVKALRNELTLQVGEQNSILASELRQLFAYLTKGVVVKI